MAELGDPTGYEAVRTRRQPASLAVLHFFPHQCFQTRLDMRMFKEASALRQNVVALQQPWIVPRAVYLHTQVEEVICSVQTHHSVL